MATLPSGILSTPSGRLAGTVYIDLGGGVVRMITTPHRDARSEGQLVVRSRFRFFELLTSAVYEDLIRPYEFTNPLWTSYDAALSKSLLNYTHPSQPRLHYRPVSGPLPKPYYWGLWMRNYRARIEFQDMLIRQPGYLPDDLVGILCYSQEPYRMRRSPVGMTLSAGFWDIGPYVPGVWVPVNFTFFVVRTVAARGRHFSATATMANMIPASAM